MSRAGDEGAPGKAAPAEQRACRVCSADVPLGAMRCPRCTAVQFEVRCPHCGATAGSSPDAELRAACDVCGAPRAPLLPPELAPDGKEVGALRKANEARKARALHRALATAGGLGLALGAVFMLTLAVVFGFGAVLGVTSLLLLGSLAGLIAWAGGRARAATSELGRRLDEAWIAIATSVAQKSKGKLTGPKLADLLGIDEAQADKLLALLDVSDVVESEFTDEGELAYSTRLRVAESGADATDAAAPGQTQSAGKPSAAESELDAALAEHAAAEEAEGAATAKTMLAEPPKR